MRWLLVFLLLYCVSCGVDSQDQGESSADSLSLANEDGSQVDTTILSPSNFGVSPLYTEKLGIVCYQVPSSIFPMGDDHSEKLRKLTLFTGEIYSTGAGPVRTTQIAKKYVLTELVTVEMYLDFLNSHSKEDWGNYINGSIYGNIAIENGSVVILGDVNDSVGVVTYQGALAFCKWFGKTHGVEFRLPTEAEWELWQFYLKAKDGIDRNEIVGAWCSDYYGETLSAFDNIDPIGPVSSSLVMPGGIQTRVVRRFSSQLLPRYPGSEAGKNEDAAVYGLQMLFVPGEQDGQLLSDEADD